MHVINMQYGFAADDTCRALKFPQFVHIFFVDKSRLERYNKTWNFLRSPNTGSRADQEGE